MLNEEGSGTFFGFGHMVALRSGYSKKQGVFMGYSDYMPVMGNIIRITPGYDCCSQMVSLRTVNGIVNFVVNQETQIVDNWRLRPGMRIVAFYDSSLPMILIYPPQYTAQLIVVPERNENVKLGRFDRNLLAADRSLQLNLSNNTMIETINGQRFTCSPANRTLLVFYTVTTRSIPPQTTPDRVIVLCEEKF